MAERYNETLYRDILQNSGFPDEAAAQELINESRHLTELLRHELPTQHWSIMYFHPTAVAFDHVRQSDGNSA